MYGKYGIPWPKDQHELQGAHEQERPVQMFGSATPLQHMGGFTLVYGLQMYLIQAWTTNILVSHIALAVAYMLDDLKLTPNSLEGSAFKMYALMRTRPTF